MTGGQDPSGSGENGDGDTPEELTGGPGGPGEHSTPEIELSGDPSRPLERSTSDLELRESRVREDLAKHLLTLYTGFAFIAVGAIFFVVAYLLHESIMQAEALDALSAMISQIFTALTGVVGGIIGFYFGSKSK